MEPEIKKLTDLNFWKGIWPVLFSWMVIFVSIFLTVHFQWPYLLTVLIIANRIMALGLLAHEGIHGCLARNSALNDFIAAICCAFPVFISYSCWRYKHRLHHRFVGTTLDYDRYLYTYYPVSWKKFLWHFFSGQMLFGHFYYFTDLKKLGQFLKTSSSVPVAQKISIEKSDMKYFVLFHSVVLSGMFFSGLFKEYFLFWLVPFFLCQPMTLLYNCLEHAEVFENNVEDLRSRTIPGENFFLPLLLPLNVNLHGEHHLFPSVPQYNLKKLSVLIKNNDNYKLYYQPLRDTFKAVFKL